MFQDQVIAGSLECIVCFLGELDTQVSRSHANSVMSLTWVGALITSVHAWLDVDVLGDDNHFLSDAIIHNDHLLKANTLLATIVEFFKGALYVNS